MAAAAVLFFVLSKVFDCLGGVWCLNKHEMNGGDAPFITGPKAASGTEAQNGLPRPSNYHFELNHSEF